MRAAFDPLDRGRRDGRGVLARLPRASWKRWARPNASSRALRRPVGRARGGARRAAGRTGARSSRRWRPPAHRAASPSSTRRSTPRPRAGPWRTATSCATASPSPTSPTSLGVWEDDDVDAVLARRRRWEPGCDVARDQRARRRRPARRFAGYAFDLDGTVYLGDALLPGARRDDRATARRRRPRRLRDQQAAGDGRRLRREAHPARASRPTPTTS